MKARAGRAQRGFTLIEVAIALLIMGLIAVGIVSTLTQQTEQRRIVETRTTLEKAREALLAFVTVNKRLPCPSTLASAGAEAFTVVAGRNVCTSEWGYLPAVTLGMTDLNPNGWLENGWRDSGGSAANLPRAIRYAITGMSTTLPAGAPTPNALTTPSLGAPPGNPSTRRNDVQAALTADQGLFVCRSTTGISAAGNRCGNAANTLAANIVAAVWSLGANGNNATLFSLDERQNFLLTVPRVLIHRGYAPEGATGGMFDDQVSWIPYSLVADRLVSLGHVQ